jgi:dihydrofolate reductase
MVAGLVGINRLGQALQDLLAQPFELVLGRRTYDIFAAYWPRVRADSRSHAIANLFNELRLLIYPVVLARGKRLFGDDGGGVCLRPRGFDPHAWRCADHPARAQRRGTHRDVRRSLGAVQGGTTMCM